MYLLVWLRLLKVYVGDSQLPTPPSIESQEPIPTNGDWVHAAVVHYQNGTAGLFFAGQSGWTLQSSGPVLLPKQNVPRESNFIGVSNWAADAPFAGAIANVRVYNRALDGTELEALASEPSPIQTAGVTGVTSVTGVGSLPISSAVNLCAKSAPPAPPQAVAFSIDPTSTHGVVSQELLGHDLEFTRHDMYVTLWK